MLHTLSAAALLAALTAGAASAVTFTYTGLPLDQTFGFPPHPTGPISAVVTFNDATFIANASLGTGDLVSFSVTSPADGLTWNSGSSSFVLADFTVNATASGFTEWGLVVEEDLDPNNTGPEQVAIANMGIYGSVIDEIAFGDDLTEQPGTDVEYGAFNLDNAGTWSVVPLPGTGALTLGALGIVLVARRRA